ncbi:tRNA-dihydrouridine(47) synthase [NAD(P)(+)]-like [Tetrabaena socialis]|uniref:tRNA-dihydrouridine(47) synthase [NAD(P)(+)]-like n=1 Tax=Tetrabaena socialis TaxID=47790 RepID=A0A2J7ZSV2_9CHLO|nr:tRNA-dihydrouridine(47) synthase [NAD(P)(+)]-like [Tetrabaena socialis]|eukprot:PNH03353.1 tRNA-dihydrouridine(47) synthase [NAD(P)(+)]-like [Tetrabaena socialis]
MAGAEQPMATDPAGADPLPRPPHLTTAQMIERNIVPVKAEYLVHKVKKPPASLETAPAVPPAGGAQTQRGGDTGKNKSRKQMRQGQASEWALLKRHPCEDIFGVQVCGGYPDALARVGQLLGEQVAVDFVDINMGCPIDLARNAFCAVRPPGHHAGPTGVVPAPNDPHGSHGFCLLSNVAIGAAYAMSVHRHAGISRVAIVDFDVHHGNGTQACVINTAPSVRTVPFHTPYSTGSQRFPAYKPWMGDGDVHNIFFARSDWVRISSMLLGPPPAPISFAAKHKSNSYAAPGASSELDMARG